MVSNTPITHVSTVRNILTRYYESTSSTLSFHQALSMAFLAEIQTSGQFMPFTYKNFLSCREFWDYVGDMPIYKKTAPVSHSSSPKFGNFYIKESSIFKNDMDVNVYTHLPYVNDGIHTHDHFELNYIYHGQGIFSFDAEEKVLKEGELLIIAPDTPHNLRALKDDFIISIMLRKTTFNKVFWSLISKDTLLAAFFRSAMRQNNDCNYVIFETQNDFLLQSYLQQLMIEQNTKDSFTNNNMISILLLFFSYILRNYNHTAYFHNYEPMTDDHFDIDLLSQYIRQNYNHITLKDVAQEFHYSESFFSKLILKLYGVSFSALIRELRLSNAHELLQHTNYTLQEICDIIGYSSVSSFSRSYKKRYGVSPGSDF